MNILIYGGHSPIAWSTAELLRSRGHLVGLVTRSLDEEIRTFGAHADVTIIHSDLANPAHEKSALNQWAEVGITVDSLAFFHKFRGTPKSQTDQFEVEVLWPYKIMDTWAKTLSGRGGRALLVSSPAARSFVVDQPFYYHATKAAINALVRWGAVQYGPVGVCVNALVPGSAIYKSRAASYYEKNPDLVNLYDRIIPAGRMTQVDELAIVGAFLLETCPISLTGQLLEVDGGVSQRDQIGLGRDISGL